MNNKNGFTVIMPTYNQCCFIRRAIHSLLYQTFREWELIIINDGCTDDTETFISDFISHPRIRYIKNDRNRGLGYALNQGLSNAACKRIAYLPSDDFFYENHLFILHDQFEKQQGTVLAVNGVRYNNSDSWYYYDEEESTYAAPNQCLQLVQCAHLLTDDRWMEREELVTYDLFSMFWGKLTGKGYFSFSGEITCHWTNHTEQRHKIIQDKTGGSLHYYRSFYGVREPVKIKVAPHIVIDEHKLYSKCRRSSSVAKKMKVLLVGDLAYNAERIYALEDYGCELYGLWVQKPYKYTTVGPLPFGNVTDIPYKHWQTDIQRIKPDIIYAMMNTISIPIAHEVLKNKGDIPMVWHFKEGPFISMKQSQWSKLIDLYTRSEGKIYINPEIKRWYEYFLKDQHGLSMIMDCELPHKSFFGNVFSPKISAVEGGFHTIVPGRMVGVGPDEMRELAKHDIHVYMYTEKENSYNTQMKKAAPFHFHLRPFCDPAYWTKEYSRYDAGWLHCFKSSNTGNIMRATWDDFNLPARMGTLAAAGLPMIQYDNSGHTVSAQELLKRLNAGLFYKDASDLRAQFSNAQLMDTLNRNMLANRFLFCFDEYVPALMDFFTQVITKTKKR